MATAEKTILEFEGYRLYVAKRVLLDRDGTQIKLMPKAFDILAYLVENNDRVVSKDELLTEMWPDTIVEENNLTQNISALRRAFGEKPHENRFISTIPGRGYRFVADIHIVGSDGGAGAERQRAEHVNGETVRRWWPMLLGIPVLLLLAYFFFWPAQSVDNVRSLAVLPFKPITSEARDEALEIGMADSLISKLAAGTDLRVVPLAAVRGFNSQEIDSQTAGRRVGVDGVLDGVMQITGNRIRVSAKLIRVADGKQLWAGQFDEDLRNIFSVQDSISERVAKALAVTLSARSRSANPRNPEAYQLYMRGKYHAYRLVRDEVQKGIAFYEQAISLDPDFAPAYVELANAYRAMVLTNDAAPAEMMPRSKAAATKAIELDEDFAEAWTAIAFGNFWFDWDWELSERNFKRAIQTDPNSVQAHAYYAHMLSNVGRHEEATREIRRAREVDPINPLLSAIEGQILFFAGRQDDSTVVLRSIIDVNPNFWLAHLFLARNHLSKGLPAEALAAAEKANQITGGNAEATGTTGYILAKLGRTEEARTVLADLQSRRDKPFLAYATAQVYLGLGDRERALQLLELAHKQREPLMVFLKIEPKWDELRTDPRFINLINEMNFE